MLINKFYFFGSRQGLYSSIRPPDKFLYAKLEVYTAKGKEEHFKDYFYAGIS